MQKVPVVLFVGLIGSGKSTILQVLEEKGSAIILTDDLWKKNIYQERNRERLLHILGEDVLNLDGTPKVDRMRNLFFSLDQDEQSKCLQRMKDLFLEFGEEFSSCLHDEIRSLSEKEGVTMVVVESALALSSGWDEKIGPDFIVSLLCPWDVRLSRVLKRNPAIDKAKYMATMNMQPTDESHLEMSVEKGAVLISSDFSVEVMKGAAGNLYKQLVGRLVPI